MNTNDMYDKLLLNKLNYTIKSFRKLQIKPVVIQNAIKEKQISNAK